MNDQDKGGGILSEAQAEEIRNKFLTPAQRLAKERREADAKRKREERAREKDAKEMAEIATVEQLWERNRKLLSEGELSGLRVKDQRTRDLWNWIDLVLEGSDISRDPDWNTMEAGATAVNAHVAKNGTCNPEIAIFAYWKAPELYEELKARTDGTAVFALTGYFTSLPEIRVIQLREMLAKPL